MTAVDQVTVIWNAPPPRADSVRINNNNVCNILSQFVSGLC